MKQIQEAGAPDPGIAFGRWLENVAKDDYQESAFGRVVAEALRAENEPTEATAGDAPLRWLRGEIDTLTREELAALRLAKYPAKARNELGRNLILSVASFAREAGVHGVVILLDEAETMFNATGKALLRVLSAMRVMLDMPGGIPGGVPILGVFSAVPDVLEQMTKYPALEQRLSVRGVSFEEGVITHPRYTWRRFKVKRTCCDQLEGVSWSWVGSQRGIALTVRSKIRTWGF